MSDFDPFKVPPGVTEAMKPLLDTRKGNPLGFTVDQVKAMLDMDKTGQVIAARREEVRTGLHIIITGNPVDGFTFYGPVTLEDISEGVYDNALRHEEWWSASLDELKLDA